MNLITSYLDSVILLRIRPGVTLNNVTLLNIFN